MFNRSRNEVVARVQQAEERGIVALGAAAGKYDLRRVTAKKLSENLARLVYRSPGALALLVDRRGIAVVLHPVRAHSLHHLRQEGRGCIGVHIDSAHGENLLILSLYVEFVSGGMDPRGIGESGLLEVKNAGRMAAG